MKKMIMYTQSKSRRVMMFGVTAVSVTLLVFSVLIVKSQIKKQSSVAVDRWMVSVELPVENKYIYEGFGGFYTISDFDLVRDDSILAPYIDEPIDCDSLYLGVSLFRDSVEVSPEETVIEFERQKGIADQLSRVNQSSANTSNEKQNDFDIFNTTELTQIKINPYQRFTFTDTELQFIKAVDGYNYFVVVEQVPLFCERAGEIDFLANAIDIESLKDSSNE